MTFQNDPGPMYNKIQTPLPRLSLALSPKRLTGLRDLFMTNASAYSACMTVWQISGAPTLLDRKRIPLPSARIVIYRSSFLYLISKPTSDLLLLIVHDTHQI
jgi:hypothetical protein